MGPFAWLQRRNNERGLSRVLLPAPWARLASWGMAALITGLGLIALAFLTNPLPDPSFPWATLPPSFRLAYLQPRIGHWPVSYILGLWLVVFTFPLSWLKLYQRYGPRQVVHPSLWLTAFPVTMMLAFTTYCRFFWVQPAPPTWNAPSFTLLCWGYCATYEPFWSNLAYAVALFGAGATYLACRQAPSAKYALMTFGVLALPLGLPALFDASRRQGVRLPQRRFR